LTTPTALTLFDTTLHTPHPHLLLTPTDRNALRRRVERGELPPILGGLVRTTGTRATGGGTGDWARRFAEAPEGERGTLLLDLVRSHVATALGHGSPESIDPDSALKELGFDSLIAVEFRNRLGAAIGLRLPATLAFNYPTPRALAEHLGDRLAREAAADRSADGAGLGSGTGSGEGSGQAPDDATAFAELDRFESVLRTVSDNAREEFTARLRLLLSEHSTTHATDDSLAVALDSATDEEMFDLIDNELGTA
ncbi:phosphopantetheine-binding protein, partial [Kitasatospora sp. NPDC127059]|uniref:phosphopantetheine-binding protein n=1 Tax=Kitasatospora sp. NPDC127059 TaxID=3347120 RepID=UPI003667C0C3